MKGWNPRFVHYATANGRGPEAMLEADRAAWPGGIMTGFILWIRARWQEWDKLMGLPAEEPHDDEQCRQFDTWLAGWRP